MSECISVCKLLFIFIPFNTAVTVACMRTALAAAVATAALMRDLFVNQNADDRNERDRYGYDYHYIERTHNIPRLISFFTFFFLSLENFQNVELADISEYYESYRDRYYRKPDK